MKRRLLTLAAAAAVLALVPSSGLGQALPHGWIQVGDDDMVEFGSDQWNESNGNFILSLSEETDDWAVSGTLTTKFDPYVAYGISAQNHTGGLLDFHLWFAGPIMTINSPNKAYASLSGSITDVGGDGDDIIPILGDADGDGVLEVQQGFTNGGMNLGVDLGDEYHDGPSGPPGHSDIYGPFESGPIPGPDGSWDELGIHLGFALSGGHDVATLNGFTSLDVAPIPEPGTLVLLGMGLIGVGAVVVRRRRA